VCSETRAGLARTLLANTRLGRKWPTWTNSGLCIQSLRDEEKKFITLGDTRSMTAPPLITDSNQTDVTVSLSPANSFWRGRLLSTVDLLVKIDRFVKKEENFLFQHYTDPSLSVRTPCFVQWNENFWHIRVSQIVNYKSPPYCSTVLQDMLRLCFSTFIQQINYKNDVYSTTIKARVKTGNAYWRGRLSTVHFILLITLNQFLLIFKHYLLIYQTSQHNEVSRTKPLPSVSILWRK
jgi:hypothetical protein